MTLAGLTLSQLATVLGIAGGLVVVLYILKLRRREVAVPFSKLWEAILSEKQTTSLFAKLKRLLSLLIALAIVALLAGALGDPKPETDLQTGRTLAVLVDASLSMQATDVRPSRLEKAREEARRLARTLGGADRMIVMQMDASTAPLGPMSGDAAALLEAIDRVRPTDVAADFARGLRVAMDALRGKPRPEIVVLSDGGLGEARDAEGLVRAEGVRLSYVGVGRGKRNVAITQFSVRRYPLDKSRYEVLLELSNRAPRDESIELVLLGDGATIHNERLALRAGERVARFLPQLSGANATLEARIRLADGTRDDLPADDRAFAVLPERRRARILSVSRGNRYLEAALLLEELLEVTDVTPEQYPAAIARRDARGQLPFDVVIFDGWSPETMPDLHAIVLGPHADGPAPDPAAGPVPAAAPPVRVGPFPVEGIVSAPRFTRTERRHPLLRFLALDLVNVASAARVRLSRGDDAVASDGETPLIVAATRNGRKIVALTFDVRRTDLPLRIAWPLLLMNCLDWFVEEDARYVSSYRTGETWHVPVPSSTSQATVRTPQGERQRLPVLDGRASLFGLRSGFYELDVGTDTPQRFAANVGVPRESDIAPVARLDVAGRRAGRPTLGTPGMQRDVWVILVLAVLAILLTEWFTYHRRWTV
ncbi:MAG: VWA domain-containing protein [Deltaproteobacteria bacterium]|nr:VWA domain-containing protein [Deltaproteobacteria bacterium]